MPLSLVIPVGLGIALVGAVLFFVTKYKKAAVGMMAVGVALALLTFILIWIAASTM